MGGARFPADPNSVWVGIGGGCASVDRVVARLPPEEDLPRAASRAPSRRSALLRREDEFRSHPPRQGKPHHGPHGGHVLGRALHAQGASPPPTNACGGSAPTHATDTPTAFRYAWPHSAQ